MTFESVIEADREAAPDLGAPIFFMHIAKTAGSYLNEVFARALGADGIAPHVEHRLGNAQDLQHLLDGGAKVISGHVMHGLWDAVSRPLDRPFRKVTILRDPVAHLASHLLWLDHYNRADRRAQYGLLDEAHQRVVDRIGAVDLTDIGHLDHYLTHLGATEIRLFDNCQSRYFLASGARDPSATRPLSLADARPLRRVATTFERILCQDRLTEGVSDLAEHLGMALRPLDRRVNASQAVRAIDITNPLVRQVLSKRVLLDQWLWRMVRNE